MKKARQDKGFTRQQLLTCADIYLHPLNITRLEQGKLIPQVSMTYRLARALDLDWEHILPIAKQERLILYEKKVESYKKKLDTEYAKFRDTIKSATKEIGE